MNKHQRTNRAWRLDQLLESARRGPTLFGRAVNGSVAWRLSGPDRVMAYRLVAHAGVLAAELPTLATWDFDLGGDLPHVLLGRFTQPCRRGLLLPLDGSLAAMLREFLHERSADQPLFTLDEASRLNQVVRFDAIRGRLADRVNAAALESAFVDRVRATSAEPRRDWSNAAVELPIDPHQVC